MTTSDKIKQIENAVEQGQLTKEAAKNLTRWISQPYFSKYHSRLNELLEEKNFEFLGENFWEVIPFGTGGRRGRMGELGSANMNERTIAESAHGLAAYLKKQGKTEGGRAVVACDTRNRSDEFSKLTATTLAAHGLKVFIFESHRSTPELSFAVRYLHCDVGVMITASHNPPSDNGFKAYWSNGGQILSPHDKGIIECVETAEEIPSIDFEKAVEEGLIEIIGEEIDKAHLKAILELQLSKQRGISILFSPLHGVGGTSVYPVLEQAGFKNLKFYEPHKKPDGNFTNVPDQLPNPERIEVFDPLIEEAKVSGAELLLASDPDADRLGVVVRSSQGEYIPISGNQVGTLIVDYLLRKKSAAGELTPEHYVVETLVTTPLIATVAKSFHVKAIDDLLVGFKYIGQTIDEQGEDLFVFGAEESLGFLSGKYARDKDAGIAAMFICELASELKEDGKTLLDRLDEIYAKFGYYLEGQRSKYCEGESGKAQIDSLMKAFRKSPPDSLAGWKLKQVRDYGKHEIRSLPDNQKSDELPQPDGDLLFFESDKNQFEFTLAVRPSGTEPKIKFYFFARSECNEPENLEKIKKETAGHLTKVGDSLMEWVEKTLINA